MHGHRQSTYFHLINLNLKLEFYAKAHVSLPVILLGAMYEKLAGRWDRLMATYKKREMNRREYLVQMGVVFLKSEELTNLRTRPCKAPVRRPAFLLHPHLLQPWRTLCLRQESCPHWPLNKIVIWISLTHFLCMSEIHRGPLGLLLKLKLKSSSRIIFSGVRIICGCF